MGAWDEPWQAAVDRELATADAGVANPHDTIAMIRELARRNRLEPDVELERELIQRRHHAYWELRERCPGSGPGPIDDTLGDLGVPPEVGATDLDAGVLGRAIRDHGCLLVRGLVDETAASRLREDIDRAFADYDAHATDASSRVRTPWFAPFEPAGEYRIDPLEEHILRAADGLYAAQSPRTLVHLLEALEDVGLLGLVRTHLGELPTISLNKTVLRRVVGGATPSWHQDGFFLGERIRAVDLWLALSTCGGETDAMGLDILPCRVEGIVEQGTGGAAHPQAIGPAKIDELAVDVPVTRPRFEPGDALLFDQLFVHRTDVRSVTRPRYAIEAWFFALPDCPPNHIPIVAV